MANKHYRQADGREKRQLPQNGILPGADTADDDQDDADKVKHVCPVYTKTFHRLTSWGVPLLLEI